MDFYKAILFEVKIKVKKVTCVTYKLYSQFSGKWFIFLGSNDKILNYIYMKTK